MISDKVWIRASIVLIAIMIIVIVTLPTTLRMKEDHDISEARQGDPDQTLQLKEVEYLYDEDGDQTVLRFNRHTFTMDKIDDSWIEGRIYRLWIHNGEIVKKELDE